MGLFERILHECNRGHWKTFKNIHQKLNFLEFGERYTLGMADSPSSGRMVPALEMIHLDRLIATLMQVVIENAEPKLALWFSWKINLRTLVNNAAEVDRVT